MYLIDTNVVSELRKVRSSGSWELGVGLAIEHARGLPSRVPIDPRDRTIAHTKEPDLTLRQRWVAARRLASDEPVIVAASATGVRTASLQLIMGEDPEFGELVEAFRAVKALPPEAKRARLADLCRDGAERAILDGRVSTPNQCVRTLGLLDDGADPDEENPAEEDCDPLEEYAAGADRFRRVLSPEDRAEFEARERRGAAIAARAADARLGDPVTAADEPSPRPSPSGEGEQPSPPPSFPEREVPRGCVPAARERARARAAGGGVRPFS